MTAELIGGPLHGSVVEFGGICYEQMFCSHMGSPPSDWFSAVYEWVPDGKHHMLGMFKGFYRGGKLMEVS